MNCPQCEQKVGQDQYHIDGAWNAVRDANGMAIALQRSIHVACSHCGTFELIQDQSNAIILTRLITDPIERATVGSLIPGCIMDRPRIAC